MFILEDGQLSQQRRASNVGDYYCEVDACGDIPSPFTSRRHRRALLSSKKAFWKTLYFVSACDMIVESRTISSLRFPRLHSAKSMQNVSFEYVGHSFHGGIASVFIGKSHWDPVWMMMVSQSVRALSA